MIKKSCGYLLRTFLIIAVVFSYFVTPEIANAAAAETLKNKKMITKPMLPRLK